MTNPDESEKSEEQLDEEAVERFDGESLAPEPELDKPFNKDPDSADPNDGKGRTIHSLLGSPRRSIAAGVALVILIGVFLRKKIQAPAENEEEDRRNRRGRRDRRARRDRRSHEGQP